MKTRGLRVHRWLLLLLPILILAGVFFWACWFRGNRNYVPHVSETYTFPFIPRQARDRGILVRVQSELTGQPIRGALVRYTVLNGDGQAATTDEVIESDTDGRVAIEVTGDGMLSIRAPGYVGVQGQVRFRPGEYVIRLTPTGSVELRISNEGASRIDDVEIELRLPTPGIRELEPGNLRKTPELLWQAVARTRRAAPTGLLTWHDLPPSFGYRWRVISDHLVETDPPHEATGRVVKPTPRGLIVEDQGSQPVRGLSGAFAVEPGRVVRLNAKVQAACIVSGALVGRSGVPVNGVLVKLFHRTDYSAPSGGLAAFDVEMQSPSDSSGRFEFRAVQPGRKRVTAVWSELETDFYFTSMAFDLVPGQAMDLGALGPSSGHTVEAIVRLIGEEMLPQELFKKPMKAVVTMSNAPPRPSAPGISILHSLSVQLGKVFYLHGMMDGELRVDAKLEAGSPRVEGIQWENQPLRVFSIPKTKRIELVVKASATVGLTLSIAYPGGHTPDRLKVCAIPVVGGNTVELPDVRSTPDAGASELVVASRLPAGQYFLRAFSDVFNGSAQNYFGEVRVHLVPQQHCRSMISLGAGATVTGRASDSEGTPLKTTLTFVVQKTPEKNDSTIYRCATDAQGYFVLAGVGPGDILHSTLFEGRVQAGGPGTRVEVNLRRRR